MSARRKIIISTDEIQFNHKPAKLLLTLKKERVSQNDQTPNTTGICSYCVPERPVFEWNQILLHPKLTPWWSFLFAVVVFPLCRWCPPQETSQLHPPHDISSEKTTLYQLKMVLINKTLILKHNHKLHNAPSRNTSAITTIWQHISWSTLAQVMASCLMAPSHHLNQCWRLISEFLWHSLESDLTASAQATIQKNEFKNLMFKTAAISPRGQWVNKHSRFNQSLPDPPINEREESAKMDIPQKYWDLVTMIWTVSNITPHSYNVCHPSGHCWNY